jgi:integrase
MKSGENTNRPAKGSQIKVEPIREIKHIQTIKKLLADNPRNLCLFTVGINTNLRASDLVKITAGSVRHLAPGDTLNIKEKKTKKARAVTLNKNVIDSIQALLSSADFKDEDTLFKGQRGALTVPSVNRLVKSWCKAINLHGNYGSHTLRKTFGYMQRTERNTGVPELMVMFNHSSQKQTLDYLCIQPEEIKDAYMTLNL